MNNKQVKINIMITKAHREFLDDLSNKVKTKNGCRMTTSGIVRSAVRLLYDLKPDIRQVKSEDEFLARLRQAVADYKDK